MIELASFSLGDMLDCGTALRDSGNGASSIEEVGARVVTWLRSNLVDTDGTPALALVRFYLTVPIGDLPADLAARAREASSSPDELPPSMPCLTLLASAGTEPAWNDPAASVDHRVIPLPDLAALQSLPMVAKLFGDLGIDPQMLFAPDGVTAERIDRQPFDVLHIPHAAGSVHVPAQAGFVDRYRIKSVLGFGGGLPNGAVFAVVMFSTVPISDDTAEIFSSIGLSVKVAVLPFTRNRIFADDAHAPDAGPVDAMLLAQSQIAALNHLLDVRAVEVKTQSQRLEHALDEEREWALELNRSRIELAASEARKAAMIEGALDCVIGMDAEGRITDFNHAAERTFGYRRDEAIGALLADLLIPAADRDAHRSGLTRYLATGHVTIVGRRVEVTAAHRSGRTFPMELSVTRVPGSEPALFSGYARDITERQHHEQEMVDSRERFARIAHTLQASLLPPAMPVVAGLELAALYRPSGDGMEVGGDFYDAFELADGRWGFALGDVCGKGAGAAVITALARYTLRAAAIRSPKPTDVLGALNDAVHRQHPDQFCTAVYAAVDPDTGDVDLGLGGHPHALLLHPDGSVEQVGIPGLLLGIYPAWHGAAVRTTMAPGDLLLFYTDGLTEARRGREQFGERRVVETLTAATGLAVEAVLKSLEEQVLAYAGELGDDLALLALRRPA